MKVPAEITQSPTPKQLFRVGSVLMYLARKQDKFRESSKSDNAYVFTTNELEFYESSGGQSTISSRKFIGKVARVGYKNWHMRVVEPQWASTHEDTDSYRTEYSFTWTHSSVLEAVRNVRTNSKDATPNLDDISKDDIDEFVRTFSQPDLLGGINEFESVSRADCTVLIADMTAFNKMSLKYNQ